VSPLTPNTRAIKISRIKPVIRDKSVIAEITAALRKILTAISKRKKPEINRIQVSQNSISRAAGRHKFAVENKRDFPYNSALSWDSVRGSNYLICLTKPAEPVVLLVATGKVRKLATRIGKERNNGKF
jgi:hypothetical protein